MLTQEEVQHIADLARIELTNKEIEKYQQQLGRILDYMEKLKEIDTSDVAIVDDGIFALENVWREDDKQPSENSQQLAEKIINMAPDVEQGQVKVKSVF